MPLYPPAVNFDPTKTIVPRKAVVSFTPVVAGVAGSQVDLIGKMAEYGNQMETVQRLVPDANGHLRPDRIVPIKHAEDFVFELEDVTLLGSIFGSNNLAGASANGFARFYITDPDDAANTAAVASNTFDCSVKLDGGYDFEAGTVTKAKLRFRALSKMLLIVDATD